MKTISNHVSCRRAALSLITLLFIGATRILQADPHVPLGNPVLLQPIYLTLDSSIPTFRTGTEYDYATGVDFGSSGYIAYENVAGTTALTRYLNTAGFFRDGTITPGSGYSPNPPPANGVLGYSFNSNNGDMIKLRNMTNGSRYVTLNQNQSVGAYTTDTNDTLGYAYERFGTNLLSFMTLNVGKVKLEFDRVCGGALWQITYTHADGTSKQMVNNYFYGRQVTAYADFHTVFTGLDGQSHLIRQVPSDCGVSANLAAWFTDPNVRMGSPTPNWQKVGSNVANIDTVPVENATLGWQALQTKWFGLSQISATMPILYPDFRIRKEVQLNLGLTGTGQTIKWKARWKMPSVSGMVMSGPPTPNQFGIAGAHWTYDMQRLYLYNPNNLSPNYGTTDLSATNGCADWTNSSLSKQFRRTYTGNAALVQGNSATYIEDYTAIICATTDDKFAVGIVGKSTTSGGSVSYVLGYNWHTNQPQDPTDYVNKDNRTILMNPFRVFDATWPQAGANWNDCVVYFVVGTVTECKSQADALFANRASLEW